MDLGGLGQAYRRDEDGVDPFFNYRPVARNVPIRNAGVMTFGENLRPQTTSPPFDACGHRPPIGTEKWSVKDRELKGRRVV
jgi:hypothetical protein